MYKQKMSIRGEYKFISISVASIGFCIATKPTAIAERGF